MQTNTTQAGDARRDALVAVRNRATENHTRYKKNAGTHLRTTMTRWLERLALADALKVESVSVDFEVRIETRPDSRGRTDWIDAFFRPDWLSEKRSDGVKRRFLEISVNSVRLAVGRNRDVTIARAAGRFAEHLAEVEADLLDFGWDAYDASEREMNAAADAVRLYDAKCAAAEYERKAQAARARLAPGVRIDVSVKSAFCRADAERTVEWISPKCLFFKNGDKRRVPLADALKMLVKGDWRIVE